MSVTAFALGLRIEPDRHSRITTITIASEPSGGWVGFSGIDIGSNARRTSRRSLEIGNGRAIRLDTVFIGLAARNHAILGHLLTAIRSE